MALVSVCKRLSWSTENMYKVMYLESREREREPRGIAAYLCVCNCACVHACVWRPEDNLSCCSSGTLVFLLFGTASLNGLVPPIKLGWLASEPQGSTCLYIPGAEPSSCEIWGSNLSPSQSTTDGFLSLKTQEDPTRSFQTSFCP